MLWCFLCLWICPQFVHIFNPICTHASVPVCFAAFLLSSGMCLQSPVVCIWNERCAQVVFTKRRPHKVVQQYLHSCFLHQQTFKGNQHVFYGTFFSEPRGKRVLSNKRGKTLAKAVTFWLLKPARRSSTQFYPFEILYFPRHQWNQGAGGCQEMFRTSRKVPHLKNLHIPSRVFRSWRLLGVFLGWSPWECLDAYGARDY